MKQGRIFLKILKNTGAHKVLNGYLVMFCLVAFGVFWFEPSITNIWDSVWYCFTAATTIGFGDFCATALLSRILIMVLSFYSLFVFAILTSVITQFYMTHLKISAETSAAEFLDRLEHLPELSPEELKELSQRAKKFQKNRKDL